MTNNMNTKEKCLIFTDCHTHTGFSDDCNIPMENMLAAACEKGIKVLAVTDHYDPGYPDPEFPFILDFENYHKALISAKEQYAGKMEILAGLEVGIMEGEFEAANNAVNAFPYDMVIGSFHCHHNIDLYTFDYSSVPGPQMVEDFYRYVYDCLKQYNNYDIIGHLTILDRYIGKLYDYKPVEDIIDEILKTIINNGKGIEINTSSFKYGTSSWLPRESVLRRYQELGGEILTFGSDSHDPKYYQHHFNDAVELADSIGFKYHTIFRNRKPEFLKLK